MCLTENNIDEGIVQMDDGSPKYYYFALTGCLIHVCQGPFLLNHHPHELHRRGPLQDQ